MMTPREEVIQNLKDAGCTSTKISKFIDCYEKKHKQEQVDLLQDYREQLLRQIHREEKRLSCLDYLIYQIQYGEERKEKERN